MLADPHFGYIAAAYVIVAIVVTVLVIWIRIDYRIQRRLLNELEERGIRRRSQKRGETQS